VAKPTRGPVKGVDPTVRAVAHRIRELREAVGVTQEELGQRSRLTAKYISQIENLHVNPSLTTLARIADGLGFTLSAFFASSAGADLRDDLATVASLVGAQPPEARRRAVVVLRALFVELGPR
jgi:transcriptional regulator with XRE-family HTH domain